MGPNENAGNGVLDKLRVSDANFEIIHLPILRQLLLLDFPEAENLEQLVDDFLVSTFLIGNDFIPSFPDIVVHAGQFDKIFDMYRTCILRRNDYLVKNGIINLNALGKLIYMFVYSDNQKLFTIEDITFTFTTEEDCHNYVSMKYPDEYKANPDEIEKKLSHSVLDSFHWVYSYYTGDCPSWSWCYPYIYSPPLLLVSKYISSYKFKPFEVDRPPHPFEQLLSILPPQESYLLPEPLRKIMFPPSPLADQYPTYVEIDQNSRQHLYQGIPKLSLMNLQLIRQEFEKYYPEVNEEDKKRGEVTNPLFVKNGEISDYEFGKLTNLSKIDYSEPPLCLPLLDDADIQFNTSVSHLKLTIFKRQSYTKSLCIHFSDSGYETKPPIATDELQHLLNKSILINWPYLLPAMVTKIVDSKNNIFPQSAIVESGLFYSVALYYRTILGIDISKSTSILLEVHPLISTTNAMNRFRFSKDAIWVPYQMTTSIHLAKSFVDCYQKVLPPKIELNSIVVIKNKKQIGKVIEINDNKIKIKLIEIPKHDFRDLFNSDANEWTDLTEFLNIDENQKIPLDCALQFLKSVNISGKSIDANLSFTAIIDNKVLDGCCRFNEGEYQFTRQFIHELIEYIKTPLLNGLLNELLSCLKPFIVINSTKLIQGDSTDAFLTEFEKLIENQPFHRFFLIDKSIKNISQKTLEELEKRLIEAQNDHEEEGNVVEEDLSNLICQGVPCDFEQNIQIGSRVVNISMSGHIPFGAIGTVVQIDRKSLLVSVVLDNEYKLRHNLRRRLTTNRGYTAKIDDLYWLD